MGHDPDDGVWTLAELRDGRVHETSLELLAWGRGLADKLGTSLVAVVAAKVPEEDLQELIRHGADTVLLLDWPMENSLKTDVLCSELARLSEKYSPQVFIAPATAKGRTLFSMLYAALGTGLTADCTGLDIDAQTGLLLQTRPAIGGNVIATIKTPLHRPQMCTVRPRSRRPLPEDGNRRGTVLRERPFADVKTSNIEILRQIRDDVREVPITEADILVVGGRGMGQAKNFRQLERLARLLGGQVGATRQAVDMGWAPYSAQIGLSGKTVSPKLYLAFGVSGAVQHIVGMATSKSVIAVNRDAEAPIFGVADLGIVGDVAEVLPALNEALEGMEVRGR